MDNIRNAQIAANVRDEDTLPDARNGADVSPRDGLSEFTERGVREDAREAGADRTPNQVTRSNDSPAFQSRSVWVVHGFLVSAVVAVGLSFIMGKLLLIFHSSHSNLESFQVASPPRSSRSFRA